MELLKKFDVRVFIILFVLTVGVDYFKDTNFGRNDILSGSGAALIGTLLWGAFKDKLGFK
ncbi:MAG: hypothetical protein ABFR62_03290 [Bacteroidota bacterium]